jgi:hypothetical protein
MDIAVSILKMARLPADKMFHARFVPQFVFQSELRDTEPALQQKHDRDQQFGRDEN